MNKNIVIVANPTGEMVAEFKQWQVQEEDPRVSITHGNRLYSLILNDEDPQIEVYLLDPEGDPGELLGRIDVDSCLYDNQLTDGSDQYDY